MNIKLFHNLLIISTPVFIRNICASPVLIFSRLGTGHTPLGSWLLIGFFDFAIVIYVKKKYDVHSILRANLGIGAINLCTPFENFDYPSICINYF